MKRRSDGEGKESVAGKVKDRGCMGMGKGEEREGGEGGEGAIGRGRRV